MVSAFRVDVFSGQTNLPLRLEVFSVGLSQGGYSLSCPGLRDIFLVTSQCSKGDYEKEV